MKEILSISHTNVFTQGETLLVGKMYNILKCRITNQSAQ